MPMMSISRDVTIIAAMLPGSFDAVEISTSPLMLQDAQARRVAISAGERGQQQAGSRGGRFRGRILAVTGDNTPQEPSKMPRNVISPRAAQRQCATRQRFYCLAGRRRF